MEDKKEAPDLLDLMIRPGFYVKENRIVRLNAAAEGLLLSPGMDIRPLILSGLEEFEAFQAGCLYLRLSLSRKGIGACVTKSGGMDVFVLETEDSDSALQALALAARELREPLSSIMVSSGSLHIAEEDAQQAAHLQIPLPMQAACLLFPSRKPQKSTRYLQKFLKKPPHWQRLPMFPLPIRGWKDP